MMSQLHLGAGVFKSVDLTGHSQSHIPREAEVTLHAVFSTYGALVSKEAF